MVRQGARKQLLIPELKLPPPSLSSGYFHKPHPPEPGTAEYCLEARPRLPSNARNRS